MSTTVPQTGLVNLQAPLPAPRKFTLLDAAQLHDNPANERWLRGAAIGGDVPGPAYTQAGCSQGTDRIKADAGRIAIDDAGAFTVYLPAFCTAQSIGPDPTYWTDRLELVFQVYESAAVERVFATADGLGTNVGRYLGDSAVEILGGGAVGPVEGLALLEQEIARNGTGMIHVDPSVATYWEANLLISSKGGQMSTGLGTPVAVGAGYIDAAPDGEGTPDPGEQWAWASGPVEISRSDLFTIPGLYSQAIDRSQNDVMFYAERHYLINWIGRIDSSDDDHIQAGVLIDRISGT